MAVSLLFSRETCTRGPVRLQKCPSVPTSLYGDYLLLCGRFCVSLAFVPDGGLSRKPTHRPCTGLYTVQAGMWRTAGTFTNLRCRLPMSTPFDPPCAYNNDSTCYYNDAPQCTMCTVHCMFPPLDRARNLCTRWLPPQECDTPTVYRLVRDHPVPASRAANHKTNTNTNSSVTFDQLQFNALSTLPACPAQPFLLK